MAVQDKKIWSWAIYDWGNSAYSTTVMAGFFPLFYKGYWSAGADSVETTARLGDLTAICGLIVALLTPGLGALADARQSKKRMLAFFMFMGVAGCFALGLLDQGLWIPASICYALATVGFNSGSAFYDSLLPSIARGKLADRVSSLGFALGYLGGGVLFTINVLMYLKPALFGLTDDISGVKFSFMSVAIWWFLFSIPLFRNVPEPKFSNRTKESFAKVFAQSFLKLKKTLLEIYKRKNIFLFMIAFWLYIDGVYTVMAMAVDFGIALGFEASSLIVALLMVQYIGFPMTILTGRIAGRFGTRAPILICIGAYAIATVLASQMTQTWHFYLLAGFIGMVQGGVQALSRSLFANMIPEEKSAEYFAFYNVVGRFASFVGPFMVARATILTGDHRISIQTLLILFGIGGFLLWKVKEPKHA